MVFKSILADYCGICFSCYDTDAYNFKIIVLFS